jgi:hypothetical protein
VASPPGIGMIHDTRQPLSCCPRCHKAELAGRARHRPVFRYDKVEPTPEISWCYRVFHGERLVATLTRERKSGASSYQVAVEWDAAAEGRAAGTLQDARVLAEQEYTAVWRDGKYPARGPVHTL